MEHFDILVVGGGHGGAQAALALRQAKFEGTIAIIGDEPEYPYERPPLSKDYLSGEKSFDRILIRPPAFWSERQVAMLQGQLVVAVDPSARNVTTASGATIGYGQLVWATGGRPRKLACSGHSLRGVHAVRTRADVDRLREELDATTNVVVIGGGYIGLEAAAALTKFKKNVTILEAVDRVLARVAGKELSQFYEAEHRAHGVDIRLNAQVDCLLESSGKVIGVRLAGGARLDCEMVIVGIGIVPAIEPLLHAGADGSNGVAVDSQCRTSLPHIFAIGDCALHHNGFAGANPIRLESVQNANDQAVVVAKSIMGQQISYQSVPWFWSNQYDLRLQTIGLSEGYDETVLRGDPRTRSFAIVYLREKRVIALDCVNATKDYVQGKRLVVERTMVSSLRLADMSVALKDLAEDQPAGTGA